MSKQYKKKEQELLDVERETIASIRQEQSHDICDSVLSGKALLDRTNVNYEPKPKAQTDVKDINSEYLMKSSLNVSALEYKAMVPNPAAVMEHALRDSVNRCPQPSLDPPNPSRASFCERLQPQVTDVGPLFLNAQPTLRISDNADAGAALVTALKQVVATPKIEYMHFDGDPIKFPSFIHNFETCLEKNSSSEESKLQLLIQHCRGKAREAIESCVNLPVEEGYRTAKDTLQESFGKPHIIAGAHI